MQELQMLRWAHVSTQYELVLTLITIYLTMIFAYLAAAHFIGRDLSRFQAVVLSSVFSVASLYTMYQLVGQFFSMSFWGQELAKGYLLLSQSLNDPEHKDLAQKVQQDSVLGWEEGLIVSIGVLGVFVSLLFMWSVRHPKPE